MYGIYVPNNRTLSTVDLYQYYTIQNFEMIVSCKRYAKIFPQKTECDICVCETECG